MAYYAYKEVRDLIPNEFRDKYIEHIDSGYEGEANYDGDMWSLTAQYIDFLQTTESYDIDEYFKRFITQ